MWDRQRIPVHIPVLALHHAQLVLARGFHWFWCWLWVTHGGRLRPTDRFLALSWTKLRCRMQQPWTFNAATWIFSIMQTINRPSGNLGSTLYTEHATRSLFSGGNSCLYYRDAVGSCRMVEPGRAPVWNALLSTVSSSSLYGWGANQSKRLTYKLCIMCV